MSQWIALMRQLCTPNEELAVAAIATARQHGEENDLASADHARALARRFGLSTREAADWLRSSTAATVQRWPRTALELVAPVGLAQDIGLDDTIAFIDRLARVLVDESVVTEPMLAEVRALPTTRTRVARDRRPLRSPRHTVIAFHARGA